jgi:hypothetical protein
MTQWKATLIAVIYTSICTPAVAAEATLPGRENVVVHEWGTFTSVAGPDGTPFMWASFTGPGDLPCFVVRLGSRLVKLAPALIRMETPVLYFYADRATTLSVAVDFPQGLITEWYPKATLVRPETETGGFARGRIEWSKLEVRPGETGELPTTKEHSHYFAARETDSAMLHAGEQREKLLFYRGVGNFVPPVRPKFTANGKVEIHSGARAALPLVMLFENHQGKIGYRVVRDLTGQVTFDLPELTGNASEVHEKLAAALEESGLYRKEAQAMVKTWKDSWFEEGMRVIYILPGAVVDAVLPLKISPAPTETSRVFAGRIEMLSPHMRETIENAVIHEDISALARFGRFLSPFEQQMRPSSKIVSSPEGQRVFLRANTKMQESLKLGACIQ